MTFDPDRDPIDPGSVELLRRFAEGDEAALERLVVKEGARLLPYIERRLPAWLRRRVGASDILQNTIVDLLDVREQFEDRGIPAFRRLLNVMAELALARAIAEASPLAVRATKRSLASSPGSTLDEQLDREAREQALCYESADLLEGLAAARERRAPRFTGR